MSGRKPGGGARALPQPRPPRNRTIFIGGALDDVYGHNTQDYSNSYKQRGGDAEYYIHWKGGDIVKAIERANREGVRPDVVGHSWGGSAAYNAALEAQKRGLAIRDLVTIDPVGTFIDTKTELHPDNVQKWVTVRANPTQREGSDRIAAVLEGKPNGADVDDDGQWPQHVPEARADRMFVTNRNHADFAGMMRDARVADDLRRPSPYTPPQSLNDRMTPADWMRARWEDIRGR